MQVERPLAGGTFLRSEGVQRTMTKTRHEFGESSTAHDGHIHSQTVLVIVFNSISEEEGSNICLQRRLNGGFTGEYVEHRLRAE